MHKKNIKLIALDLDGTLLNRQGILTEETKNTLIEARQKGIHIIVSTGRVLCALPNEILIFPGLEYAVTSNGANVVDLRTRQSVYSNLIDKDSIFKVIEFLREEGLMLEIFYHGKVFAERKCLENLEHYGLKTDRSKKYTLETRVPVENIFDAMQENAEFMENINLIFSDMQRRQILWEELKQWEDITVTSSFPHNLEIGGRTTSKADGLRFLCEMLKIHPMEVMACGDSENDTAMLDFAGISVVMGNASEAMRQQADFVTKTNEENGVAHAIRKFAL